MTGEWQRHRRKNKESPGQRTRDKRTETTQNEGLNSRRRRCPETLKRKGVNPLHPVLLDQDDNITINDIKRIVEKASTFQNSSKSFKQIKEELQEVDKIVQEFMEGKNLQENENECRSSNQEVNNPEENNRMNKVLMAVMSNHKDRVNQMGSLTEKDIP